MYTYYINSNTTTTSIIIIIEYIDFVTEGFKDFVYEIL